MDVSRLQLVVDSGQVKSATNNVHKLDTQSKKTSKSMAKLGRTMKIGLAVGAGALALTMRSVIKNTIEQERVIAQMEATLKSTGRFTEELSGQMQDYASALQKVTTFGDEAIIGAQGLLLTFTQVGGTTFPRAQKAILDVATAMGTDLKSATIQVGKALNDPVLGLTALSRSGIQFTDDQRDMIKAMVEAGNVAGAQAVILGELETQFGGSAEAARNTLGGSLASLKNAFGDLLEGDDDGIRGTVTAIGNLAETMESAETKAAFASFTSGLFKVADLSIRSTVAIAGMASKIAGDLKAALFGAADDDFLRLSEEAFNLQQRIADLQKQLDSPATTGATAEVARLRMAELQEELDTTNAKIEKTLKAIVTGTDAVGNSATSAADAADELGEALGRMPATVAAGVVAELERIEVTAKRIRGDTLVPGQARVEDVDDIAAENNSFDREMRELRELNEMKLLENDRFLELKEEAERGHAERLAELEEERFRQQSFGNELLMASLDQVENAATNVFTSLLSGASSGKEAMQQLGAAILREAVGGLVKMGIAMIKNMIFAKAAESAAVVAAGATGAAIASAYAPAAAAVSLATSGANSGPAIGGIIATNAVSKAAALGSFDGGGFTGSGPRSGGVDGKGGFAAILHPQETVVDHTKGQGMGGGNRTANVSFNIQANDATGFEEMLSRSRGMIISVINEALNDQGRESLA